MLIKILKKRHLKKKKWFREVEKKDQNIKDKISSALDNDGIVFVNKKIFREIKCISIFEMSDKKEKKLKNVEDLYIDSISNKTKNKFEKNVEEMLSDKVWQGKYKMVEWNDKTMLPQKLKLFKNSNILLAPFILMVSWFVALFTGEVYFIGVGLFLSASYGTIIYSKNKK